MYTAPALLALISVVAVVTLTASHHQYHSSIRTAPTNNELITIEDHGDDTDDAFWDFSSLSLEDRNEWSKMANQLRQMLDGKKFTTTPIKPNPTTTSSSTTKERRWRRRLRETPVSLARQQSSFPPPPKNAKNAKNAKNRWEAEAGDMEGEFMEYFVKEKGKKPGQTDGKGKRLGPRQVHERKGSQIERRADTYHNHNPFHKDHERMAQSVENVNCEDTNPGPSELSCPPKDLAQKCDKYNGGKFASCFQMCIPSYCCIHDSLSRLSPSCATDSNCRNYAPCYIIWWKLEDTIGPRRIRTIQNDDFFNLPVEGVQNAATVNGIPFIVQIYNHHFDDDGFRGDDFVTDPANW